MENVLIYILQVNILLGIVYLGYVFLLKGLTFYKLNRLYFLFSTFYALVFPFVDLDRLLPQDAIVQIPVILEQVSYGAVEEPVRQFTLDRLLVGIVAIVGGIFLLKFAIRLLSLGRIHFNSRPAQWRGYLFRNVLFPVVPFSFFNNIYVHRSQHREPELYDIFEHEHIHVKGLHTVDILWLEMLLIGCWYNPFVWFMRKAVRQNLEFLTDQQVLDKGTDRQSYQYSLLHVTQRGVAVGMSNHFNFKSLKQRIMMMNKRRSSKLELSKYAFVLPVLILAGASITVSKAEKKIEETARRVENISLDVILPHRSVDRPTSANGEPSRERVGTPDTTKDPLVLKSEVVGFRGKSRDTVGNLTSSFKGIPEKVLIVVDGVEKPRGYTGDDLNPNDIESISILKDGSATSVYGERAKEGAILITTKVYVANKKKENILLLGDKFHTDTVANNGLVDRSIYILNGKEISKDAFSGVKREDIESVHVRKGNAAFEAYGDKGKDGVIEITLKEGSAQKYKALGSGARSWSVPLLKKPIYIVDGISVSAKEYAEVVGERIESIVTLTKQQMKDFYKDKFQLGDHDGAVIITTDVATDQKDGTDGKRK